MRLVRKRHKFTLHFLLLQGTVFYENTMRSGEVSANHKNAQHNRKSVISSQSVGSSNNEVISQIARNVNFYSFHNLFHSQTTVASSSNSKNYQASSHSSSKPAHRFQHNNHRSSVSSHSDIFMKADDHKLNFGTLKRNEMHSTVVGQIESLHFFPYSFRSLRRRMYVATIRYSATITNERHERSQFRRTIQNSERNI